MSDESIHEPRPNRLKTIFLVSCSVALWSWAIWAYVNNHRSVSGDDLNGLLPAAVVHCSAQDAIGPNPVYRGEESSAFTLIEFGDYQCPFCRAAEPEISKLLFFHRGQVRYVFRNLPLSAIHPMAMQAAVLAEGAKASDHFDELHTALMKGELNPAALGKYCSELKLDENKIMSSASAKQAVQADMQFANKLSFRGTPSFLLCGPAGKVMQFGTVKDVDSYLTSISGFTRN